MKTLFNEAVEEHGEWCLSQMLGAEGARRSAVRPESVPIYEANEARIREIMERNRAARKPS